MTESTTPEPTKRNTSPVISTDDFVSKFKAAVKSDPPLTLEQFTETLKDCVLPGQEDRFDIAHVRTRVNNWTASQKKILEEAEIELQAEIVTIAEDPENGFEINEYAEAVDPDTIPESSAEAYAELMGRVEKLRNLAENFPSLRGTGKRAKRVDRVQRADDLVSMFG